MTVNFDHTLWDGVKDKMPNGSKKKAIDAFSEMTRMKNLQELQRLQAMLNALELFKARNQKRFRK